MTHEETLQRAGALVNRIRPLLVGQGSDVQGAVLVELVATFLTGHPPDTREAVLAMHVEYVRRLVPVIEQQLFPAGHPGR